MSGSIAKGAAPGPDDRDEMEYTAHDLKRETGWLGAFVIGLAGTILVTGIAPVMATTLGAASIPLTIVITISGWLLCLFLAELAAMMPDRTGGAPSYAYPAFKDRYPALAKHINGITAWAYWLGWFPVGPLNMILASAYLADRFGINIAAPATPTFKGSFDMAISATGFWPIHTYIAWWTLGISIIGMFLFFIPAWRGIRFGATFATILAVLSMIPLTFIAVAWIFVPSAVNLHELDGFRHLDGTGFFTGMSGYGWLGVYLGYSFLLTWNVIAMEAAACYIGECADPGRDAKIALNLEGGYGVFIYTLVPIAFVTVLGAKALGDSSLADPKTIFVTFASKLFPNYGGFIDWAIALMLIVALALSALNAVMGSGRALYQMSLDGEFPKWFQKLNSHGTPGNAMIFNLVASLVVVMAGGAVEIYTFSNVGYTISFVPVLIGYFLLRQDKPNAKRPYKLPEFMKYVALLLAAFYFVIWSAGGWIYSVIGNAQIYYEMGWAVLLMYLPLYWYRRHVEDKRG